MENRDQTENSPVREEKDGCSAAGKKPLIILAGPTAVGKTGISVQLAKRIRGEVISADSMQVYRGMDIGTAKITREEMEGVPHHLIDVLDPREAFNVCTFHRMAREEAKKIHAAGHVPIVVGGTGFYIQSLLYDIDFDESADSEQIREDLRRELAEKGASAMHGELRRIDPESAAAIHPNNTKRVLRAIEFYRATGRKISEHNAIQRQKRSPYRFRYFVLTMDRQALYQRIDMRVDQMVSDGLFEEVKRLRDAGLTSDLVSMQGLGYRQVFDYLEGAATREEAVQRIKLETRHFAKRQITWFKREPDAEWISIEDFGGSRRRVLDYLTEECRKWLGGF